MSAKTRHATRRLINEIRKLDGRPPIVWCPRCRVWHERGCKDGAA